VAETENYNELLEKMFKNRVNALARAIAAKAPHYVIGSILATLIESAWVHLGDDFGDAIAELRKRDMRRDLGYCENMECLPELAVRGGLCEKHAAEEDESDPSKN
jgi:hypothetical protein